MLSSLLFSSVNLWNLEEIWFIGNNGECPLISFIRVFNEILHCVDCLVYQSIFSMYLENHVLILLWSFYDVNSPFLKQKFEFKKKGPNLHPIPTNKKIVKSRGKNKPIQHYKSFMMFPEHLMVLPKIKISAYCSLTDRH